MLIINTGRKYNDLDLDSILLGLFEENSSPLDIAEKLDILLKNKDLDKHITTLNEAVLNRIGYLIEKGYLNHETVKVRIFENGILKTEVGYTEEGYLDDNWILGLYDPEETE